MCTNAEQTFEWCQANKIEVTDLISRYWDRLVGMQDLQDSVEAGVPHDTVMDAEQTISRLEYQIVDLFDIIQGLTSRYLLMNHRGVEQR